ncbi:hypothetical protein F4805DRAFT_477232 [Annulohypoxylon moriforme]|nr:hypothetical protein F4805DRAFT_477232 [Annulohypoxylon moriforme]
MDNKASNQPAAKPDSTTTAKDNTTMSRSQSKGARSRSRPRMLAALGSEEAVNAQMLASEKDDFLETKDGSYRPIRRSIRRGFTVARDNIAASFAKYRKSRRERKTITRRCSEAQAQTNSTEAAPVASPVALPVNTSTVAPNPTPARPAVADGVTSTKDRARTPVGASATAPGHVTSHVPVVSPIAGTAHDPARAAVFHPTTATTAASVNASAAAPGPVVTRAPVANPVVSAAHGPARGPVGPVVTSAGASAGASVVPGTTQPRVANSVMRTSQNSSYAAPTMPPPTSVPARAHAAVNQHTNIPMRPASPAPAPPLQAETILAIRRFNNVLECRVKWVGYHESQSSWVPASRLPPYFAPMINEYMRTHFIPTY